MEGMRFPRTFGPIIIVATACVAAVSTHVALDVVGDVALAHDAYDDLPHASRGDAFSLALGLTIVAVSCLLGLALRAVRGSDRDVRATLAAATGNAPWRFVVAVCAASAFVLAVMGFADGLTSGHVVSLVDAFGGSFALAAAVGCPIASALGASVWLGLRALQRSCRTLVAIVASIFAAFSEAKTAVSFVRPRAARATRFALVTTGNSGKRGPPSRR